MKFIDWQSGRSCDADIKKSIGASKSMNWFNNSKIGLSKAGEPAGTIHTWKDGQKYEKQSDGGWKPVSDKTSTDKQESEKESSALVDKIKSVLKHYDIVKDQKTGGFLLARGEHNGVSTYTREDGSIGNYGEAVKFKTKDEAKQFLKEKIVPSLELHFKLGQEGQINTSENSEKKEPKGKTETNDNAPDFDDDNKLIEDGDSVDFVETEKGPKIIGSPEAFEKEYANYNLDRKDKVIISDLNRNKDWMDFDLVDAIKKRKDLYDGKKLTPIGEKAFIDILKIYDKSGYESMRDDIKH